jgi:hypothetical protein
MELGKESRHYINPETFPVADRILQHKNKSDAETILNQVQHKVQHDIFGLY